MKQVTWLMLLYQLPARSSTQRVYVWRKLKAAGVVYWKDSVCLLPDHPAHREQLAGLQGVVKERGGEATLTTIQFPEAKEQAAMIERFRQQADEEYQEFLGQCRDFHKELTEERKLRHFTFPELEENEAEMTKLRDWFAKAQARDFFVGKLRKQSEAALAACAKDFERFGDEVASASGVTQQTSSGKSKPTPKLRP
jgi:hypothetical protein